MLKIMKTEKVIITGMYVMNRYIFISNLSQHPIVPAFFHSKGMESISVDSYISSIYLLFLDS